MTAGSICILVFQAVTTCGTAQPAPLYSMDFIIRVYTKIAYEMIL